MADQANDLNNDPSNTEEEVITPDAEGDAPADDQETEVTDDSHVDDDETDEDDADDETPDEETPEGDEKPKPDETPDETAKEKARREYAERQARKAHKTLEQRADDLAQAGDPNDQGHRLKVLEARDFVREVRANQQTLEADNAKVEQDFSIFRPVNADGKPNPEYSQKAADAALGKFTRMYVQRDPETGEVLGAFDPRTGQPVSLYQFMKEEAEVFSDIAKSGALRGQQAEQQMRSSAEAPGSAVPHKGAKNDDPDLEGWGDTGY